MAGCAAINVWALVGRLQAGDKGSALGWAARFLGTSLIAAWCFRRIV